MKIFCIAANYKKHNQELALVETQKPTFFLKPETAMLRPGYDFYYPEFSNQVEYETEIVIKINKMCKCVDAKFANRYYNEIGLGLDMTARDIQNQARKDGQPWFLSKGFDASAPIGTFFQKEKFANINNIDFHLDINGKTVQQGNTSDMIFSFDEIVAYISKFITLKMGDMIFTGTPYGVGPIKIGDKLEGYIGAEKCLDLNIK